MESRKAELAQIGETIREALDAELDSPAALRASRASLLRAVAARNANTRQSRRPFRLPELRVRAMAFAIVVAIGVASAWIWVRSPVSFEVDAASSPGRVGDLVEASGAEPVMVRFSEGSSVVLGRGAGMRVLSTEPSGARVLIETGTVDVAVAHSARRRTRWTFEAGPFHVLVTGTKFRVSWNVQAQSFSARTSEGSVLVSGGCLTGARTLGVGETLSLQCPNRTAAATDEPPAPNRETIGARETSAPSDPWHAPVETAATTREAPDPSPTGTGVRSVPSSPAWRDLLASGRMAEAYRAAQRSDFGHLCGTASASELLALADAARLSGHPDSAVQALRSARARFSGTPDAAMAAFVLGRLAFDQRRAYNEAVRWFAAYLEEMPNGPLMGDAVGRLMEARHRSGDTKAAHADAERYLRRFPEGPYARRARDILSE